MAVDILVQIASIVVIAAAGPLVVVLLSARSGNL